MKNISLILVIAVLISAIFCVNVYAEGDVWDGSISEGFASGSGTSDDPYVIENASELAYLASAVKKGSNFSGEYIILVSDICLNDEIFNFDVDTGLVGVTDGENTAYLGTGIAGTGMGGNEAFDETPSSTGVWYASKLAEEGQYNGTINMWTPIGDGSKIFKGNFDGNGHTVSGLFIYKNSLNQGLFGNFADGTIQNINVTNAVVKGSNNVGAIVGRNNKGIVSGCEGEAFVHGESGVGGVVGDNSGSIIGCSNDALVYAATYGGGVVGNNSGIIISSINKGTVNGREHIAGVAGVSYGDITDCVNNGRVVATGNFAAGICGEIYSADIQGSYNAGVVCGSMKIGGVAGENIKGTVEYCYNKGSVMGTCMVGGVVGHVANGTVTNCYNLDSVSGDTYAGGVVGENYRSTVSSCYNTASVSGKGYLGGVVGYSDGAVTTNCFNNGGIYASETRVGGVVGHNLESTLSYCYSSGYSNGGVGYVGSVVGENGNGVVSDCYYLEIGFPSEGGIGSESVDAAEDISGSTTPLSDDEMRDAASFESFDFETVWNIECTTNRGKPFLRSLPMIKLFDDVDELEWYKDAVDFVVLNGLMKGVSDTLFAPETAMTRAMVVTVLWRMEEEPAVESSSPFGDLAEDWYIPAVAWAYENEIVIGTSEISFSPDDKITREQLATILYRYTGEYKGADVSESVSIGEFPDAGEVSDWAVSALEWTYGEGLVTGSNEGGKVLLAPGGDATRAQVATILMRFIGKY